MQNGLGIPRNTDWSLAQNVARFWPTIPAIIMCVSLSLSHLRTTCFVHVFLSHVVDGNVSTGDVWLIYQNNIYVCFSLHNVVCYMQTIYPYVLCRMSRMEPFPPVALDMTCIIIYPSLSRLETFPSASSSRLLQTHSTFSYSLTSPLPHFVVVTNSSFLQHVFTMPFSSLSFMICMHRPQGWHAFIHVSTSFLPYVLHVFASRQTPVLYLFKASS